MKPGIAARVRLLAVATLAALGIVSILAVTVLIVRELATRVQRDQQATAASLGTYVSNERSHLELETRLLAAVPYIKSAAAIEVDPNDPHVKYDAHTAQDRLDHYAPTLNGIGMIMVNGSGTVLAASGALAKRVVGKQMSGFGIERALSDGVAWSGIERVPEGIVLAASSPLMVGEYPRGVLVGYSMVDAATAKLIASNLGVQVEFVDHDRVLSGSLPLDGRTMPATSDLRFSLRGAEYVGRYTPFPGSHAYQKIGFIGLRPVSEITGRTNDLIEALLAVIVVSALAGGLLAGRLAKKFTDPLQEVVQAARTLETGAWPEAVAVSGIEELDVLQTAFNRMIASVREQQQKLRAMIDLDPLTELPNHRRFKENLGLAIAREHRQSRPLAMLLLDIDRFDDFNRRHGLAAGEEVLLTLSGIAKGVAPEEAQAARYGGDEFALLLPGLSCVAARELAERIRQEFQAQMSDVSLTLSVGLSHVTPSTDRPESLALATELAVAKAKQLGRNQVCDFESLVGEQGNDPYELHRFLENATVSTIQALAAAVDAKDPYTQGHSQRVAEYAADLCRYAGGAANEVELAYRTGTLHDVGKIGIPDEILKKQGPLSADERLVMETHPALGEVIVKKVPHLQDTLAGVRSHHERWDGKGYPDRLVGEATPRLARILAIADTFDAMTSDRPYRKGLSEETALGEIVRNAGIQFDPELAEAFVRMMSDRRGSEEAA